MSESVGASVGTASSSTSQSSQSAGQSNSWSSSQSQQSNPNPNAQGYSAQHESKTQNTQSDQAQVDDGTEEIALGSIKGKVSKELAKAIKDFERGARQKFQESAELRKKYEEFSNADLDHFAKLKGLDLDAISEERLAKKYELMQMSPEQRRLHELETREQMRAQQESQIRTQLIDQIKEFTADLPPGIEQATPEQIHHYLGQVKQVYQMTEANLEREFVDAWKETGLPKTPFIGARMAYIAQHGKNDNGEPLQISEAAAKVKDAYVNDLREFVGSMDAQAIHDMLGKAIIQKLRDFDIQRVTGQTASQPIQNQSPGQKPASEKKYLNQLEWRKAMGLS